MSANNSGESGCRVPLSKGFFAIVDEADLAEICATKWSVSQTRSGAYAVRVGLQPDGVIGRIYMHRQILAAPIGVLVDHRSGNGLDNRRSNLRFGDRSNNQHNRAAGAGRSMFKGVSWHTGAGKWQVHIRAHGKTRYLGLHESEEQAARAYDIASLELHAAFGRLNFPESGEPTAAVLTWAWPHPDVTAKAA